MASDTLNRDREMTPAGELKPMQRKRIVIVGGGFAGLACARALAGSQNDVTLIDKRNHHLFQPLLYQVSTAALSPADIAVPLRAVLARAQNVRVILDEVTGVKPGARQVELHSGARMPYDRLILATGSCYNYFGHPEWRRDAPSPKTIGDAREIRARLLRAFEDAEKTPDAARRQGLLTFVIVGGGPTGVEMAGAIAELARHTLRNNFRQFDPAGARVVLVEAGPRLLAAFPPELATYAAQRLANMGVEVRLGRAVERIDDTGVMLGGEYLVAATVIWGAGIRAAAGAEWIGGDCDPSGRIRVAPNLSIPASPDIYVLGDLAHVVQDGAPLPALAQVAQQQGQHVGRGLAAGSSAKPFVYRSKGDTAVIGRHAAIYVLGKWRLKGRLAWLLWAIAHVYLLIGFERRTRVMLQWVWRYLTFERGARLID